jgi:eukaryotic-like serine/threonine-protein kinase
MPEEVTHVPRIVGRYALYDEIAAGGMASVHLGRLLGAAGFSRTVAIKRLHPQFAKDPEFVSMFLDEARIAARIRHPNVVSTLDVIALEGELLVVMDYIQGESLAKLLRASRQSKVPIPLRIVVAIMTEVLTGLHAAHEATSERGEPLDIVHRDMSPQNVLVGTDGTARVVDFGVAKAVGRLQVTREGQIKGKVPYMSPEQIRNDRVDRRTDIYAASVVLWEALAGKRLFEGSDASLVYRVLEGKIEAPSAITPRVPAKVDQVVMKGLSGDPDSRFSTAKEMAEALEKAAVPATSREVGRWVEQAAAAVLATRAAKVVEVESSSSVELRFPGGVPHAPPPASSLAEPPPVSTVTPAAPDELHSLSSSSISSQQSVDPKAAASRWRWILVGAIAAAAVAAPLAFALRRAPASAPLASGPPVVSVEAARMASSSASASAVASVPEPVASGAAGATSSAVVATPGSIATGKGKNAPAGPGPRLTKPRKPGSNTEDEIGF